MDLQWIYGLGFRVGLLGCARIGSVPFGLRANRDAAICSTSIEPEVSERLIKLDYLARVTMAATNVLQVLPDIASSCACCRTSVDAPHPNVGYLKINPDAKFPRRLLR